MVIGRTAMSKQVSKAKGTKAPVKMQKGGAVPCPQCANPVACRKAGRCLAKGR